ncbi:MAG TPA: thymidylate synthase [Candidatus Paceibacterota bacterium]|nr:thymidylate synthase [Candidatus Paceibacterota bacterium]
MEYPYKPLAERKPDHQYRTRLQQILRKGVLASGLPQGEGALTCFATVPQMAFDLANGVPLITERSLKGSWKFAIAELIAFINGARTVDEIESYGCGPKFWGAYRGAGLQYGLEPNDMGPGSYGAVFHDYPRAEGGALNQFLSIVEQIRDYPDVRTHRVVNWRPDFTAPGPARKVHIAPCHGECHFRVLGGKLNLSMNQRSADFPIGVPHNMIQYAALLLMVCQVTDYPPGTYVHGFIGDAHIYENQIGIVKQLLSRQPRPFPILKLAPETEGFRTPDDLFRFRVEHFTLEEYEPHSPIRDMPFSA